MTKRWGAAPLIVAVLACIVTALPDAEADEPYVVPPASHATATSCDLPVPMSDGIMLRADLTRPDGPTEPRPTILTVTGYNKSPGGYGCNGSSGIAGSGGTWAEQGYNYVLVDDRGTGNSDGQWDSWGERFHKDYEELIDWLVDQPWSDGTIATTGGSYMGITALFVAEADARRVAAGAPEAVKAVWADVPMADAYRDVTFHGGEMNTAFIPFWLGLVAALGAPPSTWSADDPAASMQTTVDHLLGDLGFQVGSVADFTSGGDLAYDGGFYDIRSPEDHAGDLTIPVAWTGGWWDLFQRGEARLFEALGNSAKRMWFQTPIYHMGGDNHWDEQGIGSSTAVKLAWFDHWLRDADNGVAALPSVNLFTMGRGAWQHGEQFPPADTRFAPLYLTGDSSLSDHVPAAGEVTTALLPAGICSRTTTQWSAGLGLSGTPCETDQRLDEAFSATFTTPVADAPLEITGPLTATIFATLFQPDATFSVTVSDVAPDGTSTMITSGTLQASHRALEPCEADGGRSQCRAANADLVTWPFHPFTRAAQADVPLGEPTEYVIEVFPTSHEIRPGHALRVSISGIDVPHTTPVPTVLGALPGAVTIHTGGDLASRILLPVVPSAG